MTEAPPTPSLLEAISRFNRAMRASAHRFDRLETGLRRTESALLRHLVRFGECRAGDLAAEYGMDASVVSRQVHCLVERGCIASRTDPADGRASLLAITEDGRELLDEFDRVYSTFLAHRFEDWGDERIARTAEILFDAADKLFHDHPTIPIPSITAEKD